MTVEPGRPARQVAWVMAGQSRYRMVLPDADTDYIQRGLLTRRTPYEHELLENMSTWLSPGDLVVDVGANVGNHTLYLAAVAGAKVEAFEPDAHLCQAMAESVALNGLQDQVTIHACALGEGPGTGRLVLADASNLGAARMDLSGGDGERGDIRVDTLDSALGDTHVDALKIDVEGMELDVLLGGRQLLERSRPHVFVECLDLAQFELVEQVLGGLGYLWLGVFNASPTHHFIAYDRLPGAPRLRSCLRDRAEADYALRERAGRAEARLADANAKYRSVTQASETRSAQLREDESRHTEQLATALEVADRAQRDGQLALGRLEEQLELTAAVTRERAELEAELDRASTRLARWRSDSRVVREHVARREQSHDDLSKAVAQAREETVSLTEELATARTRMREAERTVAAMKRARDGAFAAQRKAESAASSARTDLKAARRARDRALEDAAVKESRLREAAAELERTRVSLEEVTTALEGARADEVDLEARVGLANESAAAARAEVDVARAELETATQDRAAVSDELDRIRTSRTWQAGKAVQRAAGTRVPPIALLRELRRLQREGGGTS